MQVMSSMRAICTPLPRVLAAVATAFVLAACAFGGVGQQPPTTSVTQEEAPRNDGRSESVKVALLLPQSASGQTAKAAKGLKQAGELALFEFDNPDVLLFSKDTLGTPEGARAAAEEAIRDGAELIIGPLFAKSVTAVREVAGPSNVPVIAFSSDRGVAGGGVYLLSFLAGYDVPRVVEHATMQGKRRFAALVPETPYGQVVEQSFRNAVARQNGQVAALQRYPLDANGMMEPVRRIAEIIKSAEAAGQPIDALLIPAGQEALPTLSTLLPYFDIDTNKIQLIGSGDWDYAGVGQQEPLQGGWYPAPEPKGWREFTRRYSKTYGAVPPRIASLAYDAVSLAVSLSNHPPGQRYTAANLTRQSGFEGVDGLFRLTSDGTTQRGLAVLEVQKFGARVVAPAPSAFSRSQYSSLGGNRIN